MKKFGCFKYVLTVVIAFLVLYFTVGEGKTFLLKKIYPVKYQEYVEEYSDQYMVDKNLIYAVIKVESNFQKDALSGAGAKGLMQLMDKTADECNQKENFGYNIPDDLYDPEKNIRIGCYYIKSLIDMYKSSTLAITAYNAGIGNVKKWLMDSSLSDGNGGLKKIPYKETETYVKKVFRTYEMYNRLYKTNE